MKGVVNDKMVSSALPILKPSSVPCEAQIAIFMPSMASSTAATKHLTDLIIRPCSFSHRTFYKGAVRNCMTPVTNLG
jgi:hypothetical protein